jgi:hypothetical protein
LDGGRFVRTQGYEELARLVAHHSGGRREVNCADSAAISTSFRSAADRWITR